MSIPPRLALCLMLLPLAACGRGAEQADPRADRDPAVSGALADPIMADPDLASQNQGGAALSGGGPASAEVPKLKQGADEAAAARDAAQALLGGKIPGAPGPERTEAKSRLDGAITPLAVASALGLGTADCARGFGYSAIWAAKLPARLPVYPRGHTMVAGGSDAPGCLGLRSVRFVTPVEPAEVIDFYFAIARKGGLMPHRSREGGDEVVSGGLEDSEFMVFARKRDDGMSEVDLVTSGL